MLLYDTARAQVSHYTRCVGTHKSGVRLLAIPQLDYVLSIARRLSTYPT